MDTAHWPQEIGMKPMEEMVIQNATNSCSKPSSNPSSLERRARPQKEAAINCPRCNSTNTKFCYYNNYSLSQPRYFCKTCRRYWTEGGSLRNVPVGGGSRKNKRSSSSISSHSSMSKKLPDLVVPPPAPTSLLSQNPRMHHEHGQDLNLGFQSTNDFKTSSELIQVPNFDGSKNSTTSASATTSSSAHQLSALELVTGMTTRGFEAKAEISVPQNQEFQDKICTALKLLTFREPHVLVQFWSSHVVGRRRLLTTLNQPYGFGAIDEDLRVYRNLSELSPYGLDKDDGEDDSSPPARVYRRGLPEWTPDITNYMPKDFPLQECALTCNLKGYLGLPVFDSATGLCVGVVELLTSSKYVEYAYEVKQIQSALETVNLGILPVFGRPTLNVTNERRQNQLDKIHRIQKAMCDKYGLPFAQTWAVSPFSSYVAHERVLEKCCGSFNAKCIGKACMSTTDLPFYVGDMGKWDFMEACRERHLEKSLGLAGRALSSHGSCFCGDVSALSEEEYPLVHNAGLSRLTGCFTIFLRGGDNDEDYVLEFFLPADIKEGRWVLELVQTLEQMIKVNPGFELGDVSSIEVVGSGDFNDLSSDTDFSDLSDSESIMEIPTVELRAAFEMYDIRLPFSVSSGLLELENLVAQRVNLPGQKFVFKYLDDENDLIRIACDADLQYLINCQNDTTVNIIVELADD